MKFAKKMFTFVMVVLMLISCFTVCFAADSRVAEKMDAPSDMFIDLYSQVFSRADTYEVYDCDGNCITDAFIVVGWAK